jgi:uracil-DNA glycosylase
VVYSPLLCDHLSFQDPSTKLAALLAAHLSLSSSDGQNYLELITRARRCDLCPSLPLGPRPILQAHADAKILIAGQAPGSKTHEKGIPFDDASGDRLRDWLGVSKDSFYDATHFAILPMAFCYPGTGKSGDLPPPPICAETWREDLLAGLSKAELTLVIGQYAMDWHFGKSKRKTLTDRVKDWRSAWPKILPMPHPSPRNNRWFKQNPWFETELLPALKQQVEEIL